MQANAQANEGHWMSNSALTHLGHFITAHCVPIFTCTAVCSTQPCSGMVCSQHTRCQTFTRSSLSSVVHGICQEMSKRNAALQSGLYQQRARPTPFLHTRHHSTSSPTFERRKNRRSNAIQVELGGQHRLRLSKRRRTAQRDAGGIHKAEDEF